MEKPGRKCLVKSAKTVVLMQAASLFYDNPLNFDALLKYLEKCTTKGTGVSLRMLDYLVSMYSQRGCMVKYEGGIRTIHDIYQCGLLANGKTFYDVFRRAERFEFTKHGQTIVTTLGQLIFFRDMIRYGVIDYMYEHLAEIKEQMTEDLGTGTRDRTKKVKTTTTKPRQPKRKREDINKEADGAPIKKPRLMKPRPPKIKPKTKTKTPKHKHKQTPKQTNGAYLYNEKFTLKFS